MNRPVFHIGARASRTGLAAGLVVLALEGCSTATSDLDVQRAALWAAASECARGKPALRVDRIDDDGRVHVTLAQGGQQSALAFSACYKQTAQEKLAMAGRAGGSARIVESRAAIEPAVGRPVSRTTSVTLRTVNSKFLVPVVLNDTLTATFLLDTGANATVISLNLARALNLERAPAEPQATVRMASGQEVVVSVLRVKSIAVGLARIDDFGVVAYDLAGVASSAGPAITIDGLLGTDFLGRFIMTVDPSAGTLTLQLDDRPAK